MGVQTLGGFDAIVVTIGEERWMGKDVINQWIPIKGELVAATPLTLLAKEIGIQIEAEEFKSVKELYSKSV